MGALARFPSKEKTRGKGKKSNERREEENMSILLLANFEKKTCNKRGVSLTGVPYVDSSFIFSGCARYLPNSRSVPDPSIVFYIKYNKLLNLSL